MFPDPFCGALREAEQWTSQDWLHSSFQFLVVQLETTERGARQGFLVVQWLVAQAARRTKATELLVASGAGANSRQKDSEEELIENGNFRHPGSVWARGSAKAGIPAGEGAPA